MTKSCNASAAGAAIVRRCQWTHRENKCSYAVSHLLVCYTSFHRIRATPASVKYVGDAARRSSSVLYLSCPFKGLQPTDESTEPQSISATAYARLSLQAQLELYSLKTLSYMLILHQVIPFADLQTRSMHGHPHSVQTAAAGPARQSSLPHVVRAGCVAAYPSVCPPQALLLATPLMASSLPAARTTACFTAAMFLATQCVAICTGRQATLSTGCQPATAKAGAAAGPYVQCTGNSVCYCN